MNSGFSRRGLLTSSAAVLSGSALTDAASSRVRAQESSRIEIANESLTAALDPSDLDSRSYLTSFATDDRTITQLSHEFSGFTPEGDRLSHRDTERHEHLTSSGWEAIKTQRTFDFDESSAVSVTHQLALPPDSSILIIETGFENETEAPITIDRPDNNITEGVMLTRTPPLYSPQGTYRYYVDGHSVEAFADSDLWLPYEMDETQRFITHFGAETAITTSYLDGQTEPIMGKTRTTEDVDDEAGLPHSEENPPARQTIGFDVDCLDLCVDGFTLAPGESVEYAVAVSTHEGGENAVSNAREATETAEALWDDMPTFTFSTEDAPFTAFFDRSDVEVGATSAIAGAGLLGGGGYLAYRWRRSSGDEEQAPTSPQSPSDSRTIAVDAYDELTTGAVVESHAHARIIQSTAQGEDVWVLTPDGDGETINIDQFQDVFTRLEPWTNVDHHQHLLSVYGRGTEPFAWVAVEPAEYPSLQDLAADLTAHEKINLLGQACEAVHHVHRYGLVYERLSPESVLIVDGTAVLRGILDYIPTDESGYELPDVEERPMTEQADVYRLGAVAYEVLAGLPPEKPVPTPPSDQNPARPVTLDEVLLTALAENPEDRYETVLHLRDELQDCLK